MTDKEAAQIAKILFDFENPGSAIINAFPSISKHYDKLSKDFDKTKNELQEDYVRIGLKYNGRIFYGDSMKFTSDEEGEKNKQLANKEWRKKYNNDYPKRISL